MYRTAFHSSPVRSTVLSGPDLVVVDTNPASRSWLGDRIVIGAPARAALTALAGRKLVAELDRVRDSGEGATRRTWQLPGQDGDGRLADVVLEPWHDGTSAGVVLHLLDLDGEQTNHDANLSSVATIQDALLPADVPLLPSLAVAARYLLAGDPRQAGGDWFDVVPRPDGRVVLAVGDVAGHGVGAATAMGRLQAVLRSRLATGTDLVEAVEALDAFAQTFADAAGATVGLVGLDPQSGDLSYVLAGHPPPLVVSGRSTSRFLAPLDGRPLATGGTYVEGRATLGERELLLLYTDGLVERRQRDSTEASVELAEVAGLAFAQSEGTPDGRRAADHACEAVLDGLVTRAGHRDDITLVAAQRVAPAADLSEDSATSEDGVGVLRSAVADWLSGLGARFVDRVAVLHAFDEAADNAVRHAYAGSDSDRPGRLGLHGTLSPVGELELTLTDKGSWRAHGADGTGRGLMVAGSLVDRLQVRQDDAGTTVVLRHRLSREAEVLAPETEVPGTMGPALDIEQAGQLVRVHGGLEGDGGLELRGRLLRASQAGCRGVTLDLSDATRVDGAAVAVLFEARARCQEHDAELEVVAALGTPAQHVLETVAFPYSSGRDASADPRFG